MPFPHVCEHCGRDYTRPSRHPSRFCSRRCQNIVIRPRGTPATSRFWQYVKKGDGCWEWQGNTAIGGYGGIKEGTRTIRAHRLSWEIHFGPIPAGMLVCHSCDNPPCVRPDHLFLGTHTDNMRDARAKNRIDASGAGRNFHKRGIQRGERHGQARITEAMVRWIREQRAAGMSYNDLAQHSGLTYQGVYHVVNRTSWRHVA